MGGVVLLGCGVVALSQTGDVMLLLTFMGLAAVVFAIAYVKWRWKVLGKTIFGIGGHRFTAALGASEAYLLLNGETAEGVASGAGSLTDLL